MKSCFPVRHAGAALLHQRIDRLDDEINPLPYGQPGEHHADGGAKRGAVSIRRRLCYNSDYGNGSVAVLNE